MMKIARLKYDNCVLETCLLSRLCSVIRLYFHNLVCLSQIFERKEDRKRKGGREKERKRQTVINPQLRANNFVM